MFVPIYGLIILIHAIICQSKPQTIRADQLNKFVGVKASNERDYYIIKLDAKSSIHISKNNEIEISIWGVGVKYDIKFLTKFADRAEFRVRTITGNWNFNSCELHLIRDVLGEHCTVTKSLDIMDEFYVECRQTISQRDPGRMNKSLKIQHDDQDRFMIEGWETAEYPAYAIFHFVHTIDWPLLTNVCNFSAVFNSQKGINDSDKSREGNRDYVLLYEREKIPAENQEDWFPQPSTTTHWPTKRVKNRWVFPRTGKPLVEFIKDQK